MQDDRIQVTARRKTWKHLRNWLVDAADASDRRDLITIQAIAMIDLSLMENEGKNDVRRS